MTPLPGSAGPTSRCALHGGLRPPGRAPWHRRGLSLVQVLVASAILVVGLLPLFTLLSSSVRTTEVSLEEVRASLLAEELIEQLRFLAFQPGFEHIPDRPRGIRPPYGSWVPVHDPASEYHQLGAALPEPGEESSVRVPVQGWSLLGAPLCQEVGPSPDPRVASRSRLYLSPLPPGTRRFLKIHEAPLDPSGTTSPELRRVEVKVEWDRTFQGTPTRTRSLTLTTLVASPGRRR